MTDSKAADQFTEAIATKSRSWWRHHLNKVHSTTLVMLSNELRQSLPSVPPDPEDKDAWEYDRIEDVLQIMEAEIESRSR